MAVELATAYISLVPSAQGIGQSITRELDGPVSRAARSAGENASRSFANPMSGAIRTIATSMAGLFVAREVGQFFSGAVEAARESERISRQTAQVIETTGGAANVSAQQVGDYAGTLARLTGVDDELIQTGQNMLLTFTRVRNEVGEGNDIFNQATTAALDMSVALGTDMQSASVLVGKALNDPIAGLTALSRSGVQFTDQQKDQIKAMVAAGDTMGAQKIILGELQTQFGGTAEAVATPWDRLKVVIGDLQERIGAALIPILDKAARFLADKLPRAIDFLKRKFDQVAGVVKEFWYTLTTGFTEDEGTPVERFALKVRDLWKDYVQPFIEWLQRNWRPVLVAAAAVVGTYLVASFVAWAAAAGAAAVATLAAAAPFIAVGAAIAAVVAALIYAYNHWEGFRAVVDAVVAWLVDVAWPAIQSFADFIKTKVEELAEWWKRNWDDIKATVDTVVGAIQTVIEAWITYIKTLWQTFGDEILAIATIIWDQIKVVIDTVINVIRGIIQTVSALIRGDWEAAWDGIKGIVDTVWTYIRETIENVIGIIREVIEGALSGIRTVWDTAWGALRDSVAGVWETIKTTVSGGIDAVVGFFTGLPGRIAEAAGDMFGFIVSSFKNAINSVIRMWNSIRFPALTIGGQDPLGVFGPSLPEVTIGGWTLPHIDEFHTGGIVPGRVNEDVLAVLRAGEMVLPGVPETYPMGRWDDDDRLAEAVERGIRDGLVRFAPVVARAILMEKRSA